MKIVATRLITLTILAAALSACATEQVGRDFDDTKIKQFTPHQTTLAQVIATLGQPMERESESDGRVRLHYQWIQGRSDVSSYVPGLSMFKSGSSNDGKDAFLWFDQEGRYERAETTESHTRS